MFLSEQLSDEDHGHLRVFLYKIFRGCFVYELTNELDIYTIRFAVIGSNEEVKKTAETSFATIGKISKAEFVLYPDIDPFKKGNFKYKEIQNQEDKKILELTNIEVRDFFLESSRYCNQNFPKYIDFSNILKSCYESISDKKLEDILKGKKDYPRNLGDVNYSIHHNKDGNFSWRQIQLINPILYVLCVRDLTEKENWETIKNKFQEFKNAPKIRCVSIPIRPGTKESYKGTQINNWSICVEKESIKLSLKYKYMFKTDISNCYPSIYTHSIAWALHGKEEAKKNRNNYKLFGNVLDKYIKNMQYGQTNGIPQGSVLMDFIAEIVLGYADLELSYKIRDEISDYEIIRYMDDYRIFVNNKIDGENILKALSEVLKDLNMMLNKEKTSLSYDVIHNSVKECKLHLMRYPLLGDYRKQLLSIYELTSRYPNDRCLTAPLQKIHGKLEKGKTIENTEQLISIVMNIAYKNPILYDICFGIFSKLLCFIEDESDRKGILCSVIDRFREIPNNGFLEIWLQRIVLKYGEYKKFSDKICNLIEHIHKNEKNISDYYLWNMSWLSSKYQLKDCDYYSIFNKKRFDEMPLYIDTNEINCFVYV